MYDQQQQNNLLATKQKPCLASSSIVSFTKNSIHLMNDAYISETTTDVKLEKMELRISHHFSTLSEYPIISRCVKTREKKLQKQCSKGCSIVFMDLIDYIVCGNRTHLFYFFFLLFAWAFLLFPHTHCYRIRCDHGHASVKLFHIHNSS